MNSLNLTYQKMGLLYSRSVNSKIRLDGKTIVITGSNTGIGKYTALDLFTRGGHIIMACRNLTKADEAKKWILEKSESLSNTGKITVKELNLSSFASVRKCAEEILKEENSIHMLINNAGVMMMPKEITEDGYELHFATNHLGHFLFTLLLLPTIIKSAPAKIINVASLAHRLGDLNLDDINYEKSYYSMAAYGRSKLANILFTKELAKRLEDNQCSNVNVYCLHPGVVNTELSRHLDKVIFPGATFFYDLSGKVFMKTPNQGAQTTLYCALDETAANETGLYYDNCRVVTPSDKACDPKLAKELWDASVKMVKLENYDPFH